MNRSSEIIEYLSREGGPDEIIIAPNAPPVTRSVEGVQLALNIVLDPSDVTDTLMALRDRAPAAHTTPLDASGTFSFGVRDLGRLRVSYSTQRGSKAVRIMRVPFTEPETSAVSDDQTTIEQLLQLVSVSAGGILAIFGPSAVANATLAYAILRRTNDTARSVIYVLERSLTFLMAHGNSIVIQAEVGSDVQSMEEGLQNALLLDPDIMYVGDVWPSDHIPSLSRAVEAGVFTLLSTVALNRESLAQRFATAGREAGAFLQTMVRGTVKVTPSGEGKVSVELADIGASE